MHQMRRMRALVSVCRMSEPLRRDHVLERAASSIVAKSASILKALANPGKAAAIAKASRITGAKMPTGLDDAPVRLEQGDGLSALVSELDDRAYSAEVVATHGGLDLVGPLSAQIRELALGALRCERVRPGRSLLQRHAADFT